MIEEITFTLKDLITVTLWLATLGGLLLRFRKLRHNDLVEFVKREELDRLEETIDEKLEDLQRDFREYKERRAEEGKKVFRTIGEMQANIRNLLADVSSLEVRLNTHINQKKNSERKA